MYADAWEALAQWLTLGVLAVAAWFARGQVLEGRRTRERVAQPNVVVFMDHNPKNWQYLDFVVKNFGQTPAYSIKIQMVPPDVSPYHNNITGEDVGVTKLYVPEHIAVLAPGQEWRTVWDSAIKRKEHADELSDNDVTGTVTFWDKMVHGPSATPPYRNQIWLDPKMFRNMLRITSIEPAQQISQEIANVAKHLDSYHEDKKGIWVYTLPGHEEQRRRAEEYEEIRRELKEAHEHTISQLTPEAQKRPRRKV